MICIRSLHIFRTLDQFKHYMYMLKQIIVMGMPRQKNEILIDAEKSENMRRMIVMCDKPSNRMNVDRCEISGRTEPVNRVVIMGISYAFTGVLKNSFALRMTGRKTLMVYYANEPHVLGGGMRCERFELAELVELCEPPLDEIGE